MNATARLVTLADGRRIDAARASALAAGNRQTWVPLAELRAERLDRTVRSGFTAEAYVAARFGSPVVLAPDGTLLSDPHVLAKLYDLGARRAAVIFATENDLAKSHWPV